MRRNLLLVAVLALVVARPAPAGSPGPPRTTVAKCAVSDVIVAGKVASIEEEVVEVPSPYPGSKGKYKYKVAVVKIDVGVIGVEKLKEIKVGFAPLPKQEPGGRPVRTEFLPQLKEGQEVLLFLAKHPTQDLYILPGMNPPVELKDDYGKKELELAKRFGTAIADPMKALKGDKPDVRAEAAMFLILKYRSVPEFTGKSEQVAIPLEENKLILKALLEAEWGLTGGRATLPRSPDGYFAFNYLGLTEKDGWIQPIIANVPGQIPPDYGLVMKDAYTKWLAGAGKDYAIKKLVPKK